jgi:hypothetical protein
MAEYAKVWLHEDGTPVDPSAAIWLFSGSSYSSSINVNGRQQCIAIDSKTMANPVLNDVSCWDSRVNSNHICQAPLNGNDSNFFFKPAKGPLLQNLERMSHKLILESSQWHVISIIELHFENIESEHTKVQILECLINSLLCSMLYDNGNI